MKSKAIQLLPAIIALSIIGFRYFSRQCLLVTPACHNTWIHSMYFVAINPTFSSAIVFLPIAIILIFISRRIFNSWLKLAAWMIPLSIIYIAMTPVSWTGIGLNLFPFYRDDAARVAGIFFSVVSLILIAWKYFSLRRHALKK